MSKRCKTIGLCIGLFLVSLTVKSQQSDLGNWLIYIGSKQLNTKWNLHHEVQYRNYNAIGDLEQLLLRTGLGYAIDTNTNVLLGYGFIRSENFINGTSEKNSTNEHRVFQQLISKQRIGKVKLSHRYRFEQRFLENDVRLRFRYFLGVNLPIHNSKYYLSAYNELFLNGESAVFDRNRIYGGLGYQLKQNIKLELGYMSQVFETRSRDQINLITFINF